MSTEQLPTVAELLAKMTAGWNELEQFLMGLSDADLSKPKDAAGWAIKDHLMHFAAWADGITEMLTHNIRYVAMGIPQEVWESGDFDKMNDVIYQRTKNLPSTEVLSALKTAHNRLAAKVGSMTDDEIKLPYKHFQPDDANREGPVLNWIVGDSFGHYEEHLPWMKAILGR